MARHFVCASIAALIVLVVGFAQSGEKKGGDIAKPLTDVQKLEGVWVEVHALAKEKPKGRGGFYEWHFKDEKIHSEHTQTLDGEPLAGSGRTGTHKLNASAKPKTIDILLKSPSGEDWKYLGIYEFDGDALKLCVAKEKRPTAFETDNENRMYLLRRRSKE